MSLYDSAEPDLMSAESADLPNAEYLRRRLRVDLVAARKQAGLTQKEMAKKLAWSTSKALRVENGLVNVAPSDVRAMMSLFGEEEERIEEFVELAMQARDAKSWSEYDDLLSPSYKDLIGNEDQASTIIKYEPGVVPGIFQTSGYGLALSETLGIERSQAVRLMEIRTRRQAMLDVAQGPDLNVVLGEIALVRQAGPNEVMREQITRLVELSEHPRVNLLLLPFSAGTHLGMGLPFTILQFADVDLADVLYREDGTRRSSSSEDPSLLEKQFEIFSHIERMAEESGIFAEHAERILRDDYGRSTKRN